MLKDTYWRLNHLFWERTARTGNLCNTGMRKLRTDIPGRFRSGAPGTWIYWYAELRSGGYGGSYFESRWEANPPENAGRWEDVVYKGPGGDAVERKRIVWLRLKHLLIVLLAAIPPCGVFEHDFGVRAEVSRSVLKQPQTKIDLTFRGATTQWRIQ